MVTVESIPIRSNWEDDKPAWLMETTEALGQFIDMADGWTVSGPSTLWLFFKAKEQLLKTADALKAAGHRKLEAFPSPMDSTEQLNFTMTVERTVHLVSDMSQGLESLMRDLRINPVCVQDLHDGSYLVELDSDVDEVIFKAVFVPTFGEVAAVRKMRVRVDLHERWCRDHLGLTTQYRLRLEESDA